jgi:hypothetical protein
MICSFQKGTFATIEKKQAQVSKPGNATKIRLFWLLPESIMQ